MRRIGRRPFLLGSLLAAACGETVKPASPQPTNDAGLDEGLPEPYVLDASPRSGIPDCVDRAPSSALRALTGIEQRAPHLPRLYSFTTADQAAAIRAGAPIFTKATTDAGHRGYVFDVLELHSRQGFEPEIAKELAGPRFELGRFAWPFLAGTRVSPERYGDEILSFAFKPESLFVAFSARPSSGFSFFDANGASVKSALAMQTPERIAAFLFFNDLNTSFTTSGSVGACEGAFAVGLVYREFYLGNAAMLAEYSLGTQAIVDRIDAEVADLRSLARDLDCTRARIGPDCTAVLQKWFSLEPTSRSDRFLASMAFATPFGTAGFVPADLVRLADDLEKLRFVPNPFVRP